MMQRIYVVDIKEQMGKDVLVKGWVHKIYDLGQISFIQLRDKTGILQLVVEKEMREGLKLEMAIEAVGTTATNDKAPNGIEINVADLKVVGGIHYDVLPFPINNGDVNANLETQLNHRSISLRAPKVRAPFKVQEEIVEAFKTFFKGQHFSEIHTPKIIASGTEGGSEMFTVNYFDTRAFLAQSPQFYKQMMVGAGFERVFEVGHAYRAELHNTWRHLNEYVSLDIEMGFIESEEDIMDMEEAFLQYLFQHLRETCQKELSLFHVELPEIKSIPRITLSQAQEILLKKYGKKSPVGNIDAEGEILFSQYIHEVHGSDFVFLTKYPASKRPVYTMADEVLEGMTKSFDLIYKGLEITTGGQRIHDYEALKTNMLKFGLNPKDFGFYVESFKYGMPPHGGFAIGLERITMKILGLENIRQATLLPRDLKRITP